MKEIWDEKFADVKKVNKHEIGVGIGEVPDIAKLKNLINEKK